MNNQSQDNNTSSNPLDVLKSILDLANNNQQVQQQASSLNAQDKTQATQNAYQKGVAKALSEQGYKHGAEALQAGVDPNEIANHDMMQPTPVPGTPGGDIRSLTITGQNNTPAQSNDVAAQLLSSLVNPVPQNKQIGQQVLDQTQQIITPEHRTILGNLLNGIGNITGINAMNAISEQGAKSLKLGNLETAQKLAGQQPLQQKDIEQSALETQQKINQALTVPPTQAEKMQNAAAYAGYKTSALKDMLDNTDKAMAQQNDMIKNMQGYNAWWKKPVGMMPKEAQLAIKKLDQLQKERIAVHSLLNEHQGLIASGNVSTSPFIEGKQYKDKDGNTATFRNGKFE